MNRIDKIWEKYVVHPEKLDESIIGRKKSYPMIEYVLKYSKEGDKILDVGCGHSVDACLVALKGRKVVAIDISESAIKISRLTMEKIGVEIELILGDFRRYFFRKQFDLIYSTVTLQYYKSLDDSIQTLSKILKTGGKLLIQVPYKYCFNNIQKWIRIKLGIWPWGWERSYTRGDIVDALVKNNIRPIDNFTYKRGRSKEICVVGEKNE